MDHNLAITTPSVWLLPSRTEMFEESKYLSREDLTKERNTEDFCEWVESKLIEWSSVERAGSDGEELHERVMLCRSLFGHFYQEALPFCRYLQASNQTSPDFRCVIHLDSANHFDAILTSDTERTFLRSPKLSKIGTTFEWNNYWPTGK